MNTKSLSTPPQWGIITMLWLVLYDFTGQLLSRQLAIIFVKLLLDKSSCSCRQRCAASSCFIWFFIEGFFKNKCHQFSARPLYQLAVPSVPNSLLLACFISIFPISLLCFWLCICFEKVFFISTLTSFIWQGDLGVQLRKKKALIILFSFTVLTLAEHSWTRKIANAFVS